MESRRWEGSAGKDERQQKETSTTVWWVFVLVESLSLSVSLHLSLSLSLLLTLTLSYLRKQRQQDRNRRWIVWYRAGLALLFSFFHSSSSISPFSLSLSFQLFLSHSSRSTVNATIMFAVRPTGDGRDLSIEFPGNSVWQGRLKRRVNGRERERERRRALSQQDNDRMQNRGVSTDSRGAVPFLATMPFLVPFAFRAAPFSPLTFPTLYADFGNLVNSLMPRRTDHRADKERRSEQVHYEVPAASIRSTRVPKQKRKPSEVYVIQTPRRLKECTREKLYFRENENSSGRSSKSGAKQKRPVS